MFSNWLQEMLVNDLTKLKNEINLYEDEKDIWLTRGEIKNSAGNLCLHLLGNINYTFGNLIGHTGYLRNRDLEFSDKNVSRADLNNRIDATIEVVKKSLPNLKDEGIYERFPSNVSGRERETGYALIYFTNHFNYHLGQINYHRRLINN
ncbi:MAG TPA: DUF1572 family protein [Ignavibacteriaceae bacterium]|nr:DUF1572 family protein [Ignavibacteriaceae bacterium]